MEEEQASAIVRVEEVMTDMTSAPGSDYVNVRVLCSDPAHSIVIRMDPSAGCEQTAKQACSAMKSIIFQRLGKLEIFDPKASDWLNNLEISDTDTLSDVACGNTTHSVSILLHPISVPVISGVTASKEDCDVPHPRVEDLIQGAEKFNPQAMKTGGTPHASSPQEIYRQIEELRSDVMAMTVTVKRAIATSNQAIATSRKAIAVSRRSQTGVDMQQSEIKELREDLQVHEQILNTLQLSWIMPEANPVVDVGPQLVSALSPPLPLP